MGFSSVDYSIWVMGNTCLSWIGSWKTGSRCEIERKGKLVRIVLAERPSRIASLVRHYRLQGDMEDIVHLDGVMAWRSILEIHVIRNSIDRMIVAGAKAKGTGLISRDQYILANYAKVFWE